MSGPFLCKKKPWSRLVITQFLFVYDMINNMDDDEADTKKIVKKVVFPELSNNEISNEKGKK